MSTKQLTQLLKPAMKAEELNIPIGIVQDIILRMLFNEGNVSVGRFSQVTGVHARIIDDILAQMKQEHQVEVTKAGSLGSISFTYGLTERGSKRAHDAFDRSRYVGRAPVPIETYNEVILLQTKITQRISPAQVKQAISHLILPENFHRKIGPAVNAGTSIFLYGPPGNGKTTIAQAVAELLGRDSAIWVPEAVTAGGQIIRVYDPLVHVPIAEDDVPVHTASFQTEGKPEIKFDKRWMLFQRPAVMVGGELTMDSLELRYEPLAKVYEAPLQMKANGGMFLIDDFGRQQISPHELLNRWIVPLESGIDFLRLQSGQTLEVPFKELIVFSTNLDPGQLVDGAFMRRIQMKVEVGGPDEKMFYQIFTGACKAYQVPFDKQSFVHLLQEWYRKSNRVMQAVHPRDIVKTVVAICEYESMTPYLSPELIDEACDSYFVDGNMAATLSDLK